jgi:hypothetical protein
MIVTIVILSIICIALALTLIVVMRSFSKAIVDLIEFKNQQITLNQGVCQSVYYLLEKEGIFNGANNKPPIVTSTVGNA